MSTDPRIEAYLNALDKSLGQIPASDRAEIIMEMKSHILDSLEKTPDLGLSSILNSLGEPETVANRYLLEKGLKVTKPPKTPMIKWLTIGFLGTLSICSIFILILLWKFTPLVKVDEQNDRVTILGGVIDINGQAGKIKIDADSTDPKFSEKVFIDGSKELDKKTHKILIQFHSGLFRFTSLPEKNQIQWKCHGEKQGSPIVKEENGVLLVDFIQLQGTNCKVQLPSGMKSQVKGSNGQIEISKLNSPFEMKLENGQITLSPDLDLQYKYQFQIKHGHADNFPSSNSDKAIEIKLILDHGIVKRAALGS